MSETKRYVYDLMDENAEHVGLYETLELARAAADARDGESQINRIPLNVQSFFAEAFDCVWSNVGDCSEGGVDKCQYCKKI
jgi:hypothetical protein